MPFNKEIPINAPDTTDDQIPAENLISNTENPDLLNDNLPE